MLPPSVYGFRRQQFYSLTRFSPVGKALRIIYRIREGGKGKEGEEKL